MLDDRVVRLGRDGARVTLNAPEPAVGAAESVAVTIDLRGLTASRRVYLNYGSYGAQMVDWFAAMAADWRGWDGEREWASLEGDLRLSAYHDRIGHVVVRVALGVEPPASWNEPGWSVSVAVIVDPGALQGIATSLAHLLCS